MSYRTAMRVFSALREFILPQHVLFIDDVSCFQREPFKSKFIVLAEAQSGLNHCLYNYQCWKGEETKCKTAAYPASTRI